MKLFKIFSFFKSQMSMFGEEKEKEKAKLEFDKGKEKPAIESGLHLFPKSEATHLHDNPNLLHKDVHDEVKKYKDFDGFKEDLGKKDFSPELHQHVQRFRDTKSPSYDNEFNVPSELEERDMKNQDKVRKLYTKNYGSYANKLVDMDKFKDWFGKTQNDYNKFEGTEGNKTEGKKADMNKFDFEHKEHYDKRDLGNLQTALKEHSNPLSVMMHMEDPNLFSRYGKMGVKMRNEIEPDFYENFIKPFKRSDEEINLSNYDVPQMKDWFEKIGKKEGAAKLSGSQKNPKIVYDTYDDRDTGNFKDSTGKESKDYKFSQPVDNPFNPAEGMYEYLHKGTGHKLYTKNYYGADGNEAEYEEPSSSEGKGLFGEGKRDYSKLGNKMFSKVPEEFAGDKSAPEDFEKVPIGQIVNFRGREMKVKSHDKDKGELELANPASENIASKMSDINEKYINADQPNEEARKLMGLHSEGAGGTGNYKTVSSHQQDMENQGAEFMAPGEQEIYQKIKDTASKHKIDMNKNYPIEGLQREMFESDDDFGKRFKQWEMNNPEEAKTNKAFTEINSVKDELSKYRKEKGLDTPEHKKAIESLKDNILDAGNPDHVIDAEHYLNTHKEYQKVRDAVKGARPKAGASEEERSIYNEALKRKSQLLHQVESQHPELTPDAIKARRGEYKNVFGKYNELHNWATERDTTKVPVKELLGHSQKDKLEPFSWQQLANISDKEPERLYEAGISPQMISHVKNNYPHLLGEGTKEDVKNKKNPMEEFLEDYRKTKSQALHETMGTSAPLNLQTLQHHILNTTGLDKEQIRLKFGAHTDYDRNKLKHLLQLGIQKGIVEMKGGKYVISPEAPQYSMRKSFKGIVSSMFRKKDEKKDEKKKANDKYFHESMPQEPSEPKGYDDEFTRNKVLNVTKKFRKDDLDEDMKSFNDKLETMTTDKLMDYRSQLQSSVKEFSDELDIRNFDETSKDDGTKTPWADGDFRDYMIAKDNAEQKLNTINDKLLDKLLYHQEQAA